MTDCRDFTRDAGLARIFSRLSSCHILVAGDLMLDRYTHGTIRRISPEAPVSVLKVSHEENRPGGAGNTLLNLVSLGQHVRVLGRVGVDEAGTRLRHELQKEGTDLQGLYTEPDYPTPVKNRFIAGNQQVIRIDHEAITPLLPSLEKQIIGQIAGLLDGIDVVALSDYGKGFLTPLLLRGLIEAAREREIPVIADPKGRDFTRYAGATLLKPNWVEAVEASGLPEEASPDEVAQAVLLEVPVGALMITRSEKGISIYAKGQAACHVPTRPLEVRDVTGAGDTVLAVVAAAMANGLDLEASAHLANEAASLAVQRFGCARIALSELADHILRHDAREKIFTEDHLFTLQEALRDRAYTLLSLEGHNELSTALFRAIRTLADGERRLLVYLPENESDPEFLTCLSSLVEVDFIVVHKDNVNRLCQQLPPAASFQLEGAKLLSVDSFGQLLTV